MSEIREDLFTNRKVIIAKERANRPMDLETHKNKDKIDIEKHSIKCPFCYGNEHITPKEIEDICEDEEWKIRVVPNKYPILNDNKENFKEVEFYGSDNISGYHEVVIEINRHDGSFFNMSENEFYNYITILKRRYQYLKNKEGVKYITLFKNYLKNAGASLEHPHSQILTLPLIPTYIEKEMNNAKKYFKNNHISLHEAIINHEKDQEIRIINECEHFIILAPYASFYNYEVEIICKDIKRFENICESEIRELSKIMKKLFENMYNVIGNFAFNMYIHTHPIEENEIDVYKWHIHIAPRIAYQAGFELSTGIYVNAVPPENAAKLIRW